MKTILKLLPILLLAWSMAGCEGYVSSIPDQPVYFKRNLNTSNLSPFGSYLYITAPELASDRIGFGGLLVYHAQDNVYYAVDLSCPKEVNPKVRIGKPSDAGMCRCDSCGEIYDMSFGQGIPTKGISKEPLRHYTVNIDENDYIFITR